MASWSEKIHFSACIKNKRPFLNTVLRVICLHCYCAAFWNLNSLYEDKSLPSHTPSHNNRCQLLSQKTTTKPPTDHTNIMKVNMFRYFYNRDPAVLFSVQIWIFINTFSATETLLQPLKRIFLMDPVGNITASCFLPLSSACCTQQLFY